MDLPDFDGSTVPGGSRNTTEIGSPLTPNSLGRKIEDFTSEQGGLLAIPYGEHLIGGQMIAHMYEVGPPPASVIFTALGDGQHHGWEGVVETFYQGEALTLSPDALTAGYRFHPGTASTGIADPVQGVDPFLPGGLAYPGTAYMAVKLPEYFAIEDNPQKLITRAKCLKTMDYDQAGAEIGASYSTNPARAAADRIRRYYERKYFNNLALAYVKFRDRIHWPSWHRWKEINDELITWNDGTSMRSIKRFEYHGAFIEDGTLGQILDDICGSCCSFWVDDGVFIRFVTPFDTQAVHHFNLSNIAGNTVESAPKDIRIIPNVMIGNFRNLDSRFLAAGSVERRRDDLIRRIGRNVSEVNLPNMTHSQAQRLMRRKLILEAGPEGSGSPQTLNLRGQPDSLHVLPGDIVTVSHPMLDLNYQTCLVLGSGLNPSEQKPDQTDFSMLKLESAIYDDNWHGPIQGQLSAVSPIPLTDLEFWYEARNPGGAYSDGDPITDMVDLSINGRNIDAMAHTWRAGGGSPYIELALAGAYNGGFNVSSILDIANPSQFSAFYVSYYNSTLGVSTNNFFSCGTTTNLFRILNPWTDGRHYLADGNAFTGGEVSTPNFAQQYDLTFHVWEFHRTGTTPLCFYDGIQVSVPYNIPFAAPTLVSAGPERCYMFGSNQYSGGRLRAKAGLLYSRFLTTAERVQVRSYLATL